MPKPFSSQSTIFPQNRIASICRSLLLCGIAGAALGACLPGTASAGTILFTEDFQTGSPALGAPWHGYNGWSEVIVGEAGVRWTQIRGVNPERAGSFLYSSNVAGSDGAGRVNYSFGGTPYALADGLYRMTFDLQGRMYKPFQVTLADSSDHRIGLQVGVNSNTSNQSVAGVYLDPSGNVTRYTEGGFSSTNGSTPAGWAYDSFYTVHIDINGTSSEMTIDGLTLGAGKVRVIYNANNPAVATYTMVFDLPDDFQNISAISLIKPVEGYRTSWAVDNIVFQVEPIPEPATAALLLVPLAGWMVMRRRRHHCQQQIS